MLVCSWGTSSCPEGWVVGAVSKPDGWRNLSGPGPFVRLNRKDGLATLDLFVALSEWLPVDPDDATRPANLAPRVAAATGGDVWRWSSSSGLRVCETAAGDDSRVNLVVSARGERGEARVVATCSSPERDAVSGLRLASASWLRSIRAVDGEPLFAGLPSLPGVAIAPALRSASLTWRSGLTEVELPDGWFPRDLAYPAAFPRYPWFGAATLDLQPLGGPMEFGNMLLLRWARSDNTRGWESMGAIGTEHAARGWRQSASRRRLGGDDGWWLLEYVVGAHDDPPLLRGWWLETPRLRFCAARPIEFIGNGMAEEAAVLAVLEQLCP